MRNSLYLAVKYAEYGKEMLLGSGYKQGVTDYFRGLGQIKRIIFQV